MKPTVTLSAMTRQEIADLYKTTWKSLKKRIDIEGIRLPRGLVYPVDIIRIFEVLGWPEGKKHYINSKELD